MSDTSQYLKRAAQRVGFKREHFIEKSIPTEASNIVAVPFYGDLNSTFIFSSLLLRSYKDANPDKYIVLCSWPGFQGLFPYVDEYWTIEDESVAKTLAIEANNFYNGANISAEITRSLVEVLNVVTARDLKRFYNKGFTKDYWNTFGEIKRFLPEVPSANLISADFKVQMENRPGRKIIVYPATRMRSWQQGKSVYLPVSKEFWITVIEKLIQNDYDPVIYQNWFTYDMSRDFLEKCMYLATRSINDTLAAFRYVGCVLDIHTGISRLAIAARCPYLSVTERRIFTEDRDYEVDDLCAQGLLRQYIFSFATQMMIDGPAEWEVTLLNNIMTRLKTFVPTIDMNALPSTTESYFPVSYESVRKRNARRFGMAFINTYKQK